jgi:hypothetical protein
MSFDPIFFNGGDIGTLAINGTVNDLAVGGAIPLYLTCGMIIEEGLAVDDLRLIATSMKAAASKGWGQNCQRRHQSSGTRRRRQNLYQHLWNRRYTYRISMSAPAMHKPEMWF